MILPPFAEEFNEDFPTIPQPYFDDHQVRKEHHLQQRLKQFAPPVLDGGRAILWFCRLCNKPWYEHGHRASFVCLSTSQLAEITQQLGAVVHSLSSFPLSICPLCAALHLGGMPRIEEYPDGQGYRFTWDAITARHTRLFCIVYNWNMSSISDMLLKVCAAQCDVLTASIERVKDVLAWLKRLTEPGEEEVVLLTGSAVNAVSRFETPAPGYSWCGYAWQTQCHSLGDVLLVLGMTFPTSSICSLSLLVACWRQIAREIEEVLAC
jgi:hypothetical protein